MDAILWTSLSIFLPARSPDMSGDHFWGSGKVMRIMSDDHAIIQGLKDLTMWWVEVGILNIPLQFDLCMSFTVIVS